METLVSTAKQFKEKFNLDSELITINSDLSDIFERGVLTSVRVSAERFGFTLRLVDLGLVPTRDKSKDKTQAAIDAVLRNTQRASLLPRDEMWYTDSSGNRLSIPRFENTERTIRLLFPTKSESVQRADISSDGASQSSSMTTISSMWAIPMNGMTFVPESSFPKWKEELDAATAAHKKVAEIICDNYSRIQVASIRHYEQIALDVYNRLRQTSPDQIQNINPLEFTRRWKRAVFNAWPSPDSIMANFNVDVNYYWAPLPSRIREERVRVEEIESQAKERRQERQVAQEISSLVSSSQSNQIQNLTVSYVRTLLERTESVFLNFLQFLNESDRSPSVVQLNTIVKVVEMINVMGSGIASFDQIRDMASNIDQIVSDYKKIHTNSKDRKALAESLRQPNAALPEALANAIALMRTEVESMVGKEGRRTFFTDQNPFDICSEMWSDYQLDSSVRIVAEYDDNGPVEPLFFVEDNNQASSYRDIPSLS